MHCFRRLIGFASAVLLALASVGRTAAIRADDMLLVVEPRPVDRTAGNWAVAHVELTAAANWCHLGKIDPAALQAVGAAGQTVPLLFVPDPDYDSRQHLAGTIVARLPGTDRHVLRLVLGKPATTAPFDGRIKTAHYAFTHDPRRNAGLPSRIEFPASGLKIDQFRWNERLHLPELGSAGLASDPQPQVQVVGSVPGCQVVRVRAKYQVAGKPPPASPPAAVYDWYYFDDSPLILVKGYITQQQPFAWKEVHFLEMDLADQPLHHWAGGTPAAQGDFSQSGQSQRLAGWGALIGGRDAIGMLGCGTVLVYDGRGPLGHYLQSNGDNAWKPWNGTRLDLSAWLWIGSDAHPADAITAAASRPRPDVARAWVTTSDVRRAVEVAVQGAKAGGIVRAPVYAGPRTTPPINLKGEPYRYEQVPSRWLARMAAQQEARGNLAPAFFLARGNLYHDWAIFSAGDLRLVVEAQGHGIRLVSLSDEAADRELLAPEPAPLFELTLRNLTTEEEVHITSDSGWSNVVADHCDAFKKPTAEFDWGTCSDKRLGDLNVIAFATLDGARHSLGWNLLVSQLDKRWTLRRVLFPQVALAASGPKTRLFLPQAAGIDKPLELQEPHFHGTYPTGWTAMPWMAIYEPGGASGLYAAMHDPLGSLKELRAEQSPNHTAVTLGFDHPVGGTTKWPATSFSLPGRAVWQLLRGDWFDAAMIYRDWVRREARWYPKLTVEGRADTPRWMRELCVWAIRSGSAKECVPAVAAFAQAVGQPTGLHWYSWHQIPFDNDYPHYFPTKPGFAEGVAELQRAGVFVMPYINGRLWDTRDRGLEDFEFTRLALPAATKDEHGQPYVESYSSKEQDGSKVKLAVMCPTTELWQRKLREIVLRLMNDEGVKGVYLDQIAAAKPELCFDAAHNHLPGGGHWWTEQGYWPLLEAIRKAMPRDRILTTECNAEPYVRWFDGYLTWHWQYDGQVPAFPAVYGGAIQMFGRAYRGGPSADLALRMKAAQQLVFGEQIGWIDPAVAVKSASFPFFRQVVQLRWQLRDYFYAGEMARPPRLEGPIPRVTADWQWHGTWPVTTDTVLTGAWSIPAQKRLVLISANVSQQAVKSRLRYDARPYGPTGAKLRLRKVTVDGRGPAEVTPALIDREVEFAPQSAWAWELQGE